MAEGSQALFEDLRARADRFRAALAEQGIGLVLLQQSTDKYYLAGSVQQGFVAVAPDRSPVFFCRKGAERTRRETPWPVVSLERPKDLPGLLSEAGFATSGKIGFEADVVPVQLYEQLRRLFPGAELVDASGTLRVQRQVKSAYELGEMRAAGAVWTAMMEETRRGIRPGVDDYLLSIAVDTHGRMLGGQGLMRTRGFNFEYFTPQILAGPPGAVPTQFDGPTGGEGPHPVVGQGGTHRRIAPGEPVLVDFAVAVRGYVADGTRTFAIGALPAELQRAAQVAVEILEEAEAGIRPGLPIGDVFRRAKERAEAAGLSEHFMGYRADRVRFLGHGIGLELDETPVITESAAGVFMPGMAVAIEPKFVFPGYGAVGVEDSFVVRAEGPAEILTVFARGPVLAAEA